MSRHVASLFCILLFHFVSFAQSQGTPDSASFVINEIKKFFLRYPQQSATLITDNSIYLPGERIWYKVYINDSQNDVGLSRSMRVVLRNGNGSIAGQQLVQLVHGQGHGDLVIPDTLSLGLYSLEVYTDWMRNFSLDPLADRALCISSHLFNSAKALTFGKAFIKPEGNSIVFGRKNKVALYSGAGAPFLFEIVDENDSIIFRQQFNESLAIAEVSIPKIKSLSGRISVPGLGSCHQVHLPIDNPSIVIERKGEAIVNIKFLQMDYGDHTLIATSETNFVKAWSVMKTDIGIDVDLSDFPPGPVHFMLFNDKVKLLSARSIYNAIPEIDSPIMVKSEQKNPFWEDVTLTIRKAEYASDIMTFIVAEEGYAGVYDPAQVNLGAHTPDDLMLFATNKFCSLLPRYIEGKPFTIRYQPNRLFMDEINHLRSPAPFSLLLAEVVSQKKILDVTLYKEKIKRLEESYASQKPLAFEPITPDEKYDPNDYPTLKTVGQFMLLAIPKLKHQGRGANQFFFFLYNNLNGYKSSYLEPPSLVVDNKVVNSFGTIKDIPLSSVKSISVIYNSRTLVDQSLETFFPSGAVMILLKEGEAEKQSIKTYPFLWRSFDWPHQFAISRYGDGSRSPIWRSLYYWNPALTFTANRQNDSVRLTAPHVQRLLMIGFSSTDHFSLRIFKVDLFKNLGGSGGN